MLDADVIGMAEVDGSGGENNQAYADLMKMMNELHDAYQYFEKPNHLSGSAIFYKGDKFNLIYSSFMPFKPGASQSYMHCHFSLVDNPEI